MKLLRGVVLGVSTALLFDVTAVFVGKWDKSTAAIAGMVWGWLSIAAWWKRL